MLARGFGFLERWDRQPPAIRRIFATPRLSPSSFRLSTRPAIHSLCGKHDPSPENPQRIPQRLPDRAGKRHLLRGTHPHLLPQRAEIREPLFRCLAVLRLGEGSRGNRQGHRHRPRRQSLRHRRIPRHPVQVLRRGLQGQENRHRQLLHRLREKAIHLPHHRYHHQ